MPDDRLLAGHKFFKGNAGGSRRCVRCGAAIIGSNVWGWFIEHDPAGRSEGPYERPPACAARVDTLIPSLLN